MKRVIQITISLALLLILFYWVDLEQIEESLIEARYSYIFMAVIIITLDCILMGFKWKLLLGVKKINISLYKATKIYYISNFLGLFLPPTLGTDMVRAYYVSKDGGKLHDILASILMERYLGFLGIFIMGLLGCLYIFHFVLIDTIDITTIMTFIGILTLVTTVGFFISLSNGMVNLIKNFLARFKNKKFLSKILTKAVNLLDSFAGYKNHKTILTVTILLTFLEIFLVILWSYSIAVGLNISVSFLYFVSFIPITLFLVRLPISLDGFGINEGSYAYFLAAIGISETLGFSLGLINHFITILAIIPGGIFWALHRNKNEIKNLQFSTIQAAADE